MERAPLAGSMAKLLSTSPESIEYKNAELMPISRSVAYIAKLHLLVQLKKNMRNESKRCK